MKKIEQKIRTTVYMWLVDQYAEENNWLHNDVLWDTCPYNKYIAREDFDKLIYEMKTVENFI